MEIWIDGRILLTDIGNAGNFFLRLLGWFNPSFRRKNGVLIHPCNSIHTFGMGSGIDVVFIDDSRRIMRIVAELPPWRLAFCPSAHYALELRSGVAGRLGLYEGKVVEFAFS